MRARVDDVDVSVKGTLKEGRVDAKLELEGREVGLDMSDSTGAALLLTSLEGLDVSLKGEGDLNKVDGQLRLTVKGGTLNAAGNEMVNEALQASKNDLLSVSLPFNADLRDMNITLGESRIKVDDYALCLEGDARLKTESHPMGVNMRASTEGAWRVKPLLAIVPKQFTQFANGMDMDAEVSVEAEVTGSVTDSTFPLIDAEVGLAKGRFYYPKALPYKLTGVEGDMSAHIDLNKTGKSGVEVSKLNARTRDTRLSVKGRVDDLLGDMLVDANVKGSLPLADVMPLLPDSLPLTASGNGDVDVRAKFRLSDIQNMALEKVVADGKIGLKKLDVLYDSIHAMAPSMEIALQLPAKNKTERVADAQVSAPELRVDMGNIAGTVESPVISVSINNPMRKQLGVSFDIAMGESEGTMDSMMVSFGALAIQGTMQMDSTQSQVLRRFTPRAVVDMHSAVLYMPSLPDAVRLSQFNVAYNEKTCEIKTANVKVGHSDFQLYGTVENLEQWLSQEDMLRADLNFTSNYTDVDQLMDMISGMGSDADSIEKMREEDKVPSDANPFIVPKDIDVTLHTHIKRSIAFGNDLSDVAGTLTINDGVAVLDQMGFVCKAATMQLTALYKSPRPSHLFTSLDFHLLDIQIDELLDMIPAVDTLVPMLAAFNGNADFHLAAETYLNARYQPLMSSLKGAAAITGKDLTILDNNSIAQIAKLMQFKSWKDKDNKIKVDSIDVELTCLNKVVEVYPFILNIGKYQLCASGKHSLDNNCGYHIELLKNPLLAKVGVDVSGKITSPKITLGEVRYSDFYRPDKQGVVERQTLELKRQIKEALEAKVK